MSYVDPNSPAHHSEGARSASHKKVDPSQDLIRTSEVVNSMSVGKLEKLAEQLDTAYRRLTEQEQNLGRSISGRKRKLSEMEDAPGERASHQAFNKQHLAGQALIRNNPPKFRSPPPK